MQIRHLLRCADIGVTDGGTDDGSGGDPGGSRVLKYSGNTGSFTGTYSRGDC
jgi:hypothetical protein